MSAANSKQFLFLSESPDASEAAMRPSRGFLAQSRRESVVARYPDFGTINGQLCHLRCGQPALFIPSQRLRDETRPGMTVGRGKYLPEEVVCPHCGSDNELIDEPKDEHDS